MTQQEMLNRLGLTMSQLQDLLDKLCRFIDSLDDSQRNVVKSSMPTVVEAASWFGRDVTAADLQALLEMATPKGAIVCANIGVRALAGNQ